MNLFKIIETFVAVAQKGSLTAAAAAEGVAPAVVGRRLDALEKRLGVKLLVRTTRKLTLTFEGTIFLDDCQRILADLDSAEAGVAAGGAQASGPLRITAPAGFGRRHVAPLLAELVDRHPAVTVSLELSDRIVDLVNEGFDCAVRIGALADSSLASVKLADNRRVCVAAPAYLERFGTPSAPDDLTRHRCLGLDGFNVGQRGWTLSNGRGQPQHVKVTGPLLCSDGAVLREWCLEGRGIAWRSWWEVGADIAAGRLRTVLDDFAAPVTGIYAVFPQRRHLPLRLRLLIDLLKERYGSPTYWERESTNSVS